MVLTIRNTPKSLSSSLNAAHVVNFMVNTNNVRPASGFEFDMPDTYKGTIFSCYFSECEYVKFSLIGGTGPNLINILGAYLGA